MISQKNTFTLLPTKKNGPNSFEKDFFKLMSNSTFAKTMENLRKIINIRLVNKAGNYKKYVGKPSFALIIVLDFCVLYFPLFGL